jgi:hypothetical protein
MALPELPVKTALDGGVHVAFDAGTAGDGTTSGFAKRKTDVRITEMREDRVRPGLLRSSKYHSAGLTRASVTESWRVDCQGNLR